MVFYDAVSTLYISFFKCKNDTVDITVVSIIMYQNNDKGFIFLYLAMLVIVRNVLIRKIKFSLDLIADGAEHFMIIMLSWDWLFEQTEVTYLSGYMTSK